MCLLKFQERAGPEGNDGQRRISRSPRNQRSRSADVDCLKKYTERRVEERRYTEVTDTSRLDTSKWIPLSKNLPPGQQAVASKRPFRDEQQESIDEPIISSEGWSFKPASIAIEKDRFSTIEPEMISRQLANRSYSTDVTAMKSEKRIIEQRRHTECSDPHIVAARWIPQISGGKFHREPSPLARIDCEITQSATTRWTASAKTPSPNSMPRINPETRDSITEYHRKNEEELCKDPDAFKWQPPRKFSPAKSERGQLQRQDELDMGRDRSPSFIDANEQRTNKLSQRMRDLYDFKTENEWPKRTKSPQQQNQHTWISKSSSEEDRAHYPPVRRNSQDLEFNDRMNRLKAHREQENRSRPKCSTQNDVFMDEQEERLRKFNDKLRYSEDLGTERVRIRERRTYSDDYDEKSRRESRMSRQSESLTLRRPATPARRMNKREHKRNSEANARSRESRVSYVEVDFSKRDSRSSDASYASVNVSKRGSVECRSTQQIMEIPPRRAFSQSEERPASPVPPIEWNDEHYIPKKLSLERQRDSTRARKY